MPADILELTSAIDSICRISGEFTLRSGSITDEYFDKYRFEGDPQLLRRVAEHMVPLLPADTQVGVLVTVLSPAAMVEPVRIWAQYESFNGRFRDEFFTTEQFDTLLESQVLAEDWRIEYNIYRPHGSLGNLTPEAFKQQWTKTQPALS